MSGWVDVALFSVVLVATVTDLRSARIPNWLTLPAAVFGACLHFALRGVDGLLFSLSGWFAGFALLIGFYAVGGMGAGDVKLLAACGSLVGASRTVWIAIFSALAGGVYALGIVVYSMVLRTGFAGVGQQARAEAATLLASGGSLRSVSESLQGYPRLRYAVAVTFGVAAEALMGRL